MPAGRLAGPRRAARADALFCCYSPLASNRIAEKRQKCGRCHGVMVPIKHKRGRGEEVQRVFTGNLVLLYWPA